MVSKMFYNMSLEHSEAGLTKVVLSDCMADHAENTPQFIFLLCLQIAVIIMIRLQLHTIFIATGLTRVYY